MFNIYLKFDESLGKEGLARDYSILGEENFGEIIKRYKEGFEGKYATRSDLGGVGDVDYLVAPYAFFDPTNMSNPVSVMLVEMGQVFYYPINLACYWFSAFPLDSFRIEEMAHKYLLNDVIETYYESLKQIQLTAINNKKLKGLYYVSKTTLERRIPVLYDFKNEVANSFEDIAKNRYDLVFQEDGLTRQLDGFARAKGLEIVQKKYIENLYPVLFKNIISYTTTKLDKEMLLVKNDIDNKLFHLIKKKNDVFFTTRAYYRGQFLTASIFDFFSIDLFEHINFSAFLNKENDNINSNTRALLIEFVHKNFNNVISIKILYDPIFNTEKLKYDVNAQSEVIYVNDSGFIRVEQLNLNQAKVDFTNLYKETISSGFNRVHLNEPIVQIIDISRVYSNENTSLDTSFAQESVNLNHSNKYNLPVVFLEKYSYLTKSSHGEMPRKEFQYSYDDDIRGWIEYFFMNHEEYRTFNQTREKLGSDFLSKYVSYFENKEYNLFFSTIDLSVTINEVIYDEKPKDSLLKVIRIDDYIDYSTTIKDLEEVEVLNLYREIINYAFFFQKNLVQKYGSIEYLLTIVIRNGEISIQRVNLLTEEGDKMLIHDEWF